MTICKLTSSIPSLVVVTTDTPSVLLYVSDAVAICRSNSPFMLSNVLPNILLLPLRETTRNRLGRFDCAIISCWACSSARQPLSLGMSFGSGACVGGLLDGRVRWAYPVASNKQVIIVSLVSHMLNIYCSCFNDEYGHSWCFYSLFMQASRHYYGLFMSSSSGHDIPSFWLQSIYFLKLLKHMLGYLIKVHYMHVFQELASTFVNVICDWILEKQPLCHAWN